MAKIGHILCRLKGTRYFTILDIRSGYHQSSIHPDSRPKNSFYLSIHKFQMEMGSIWSAIGTQCSSKFMFKLSFKYLDDFFGILHGQLFNK